MKVIEVKKENAVEQLDKFYDRSVFTFEGLDLDGTDKEEMEQFFRDKGYNEEEFICYWFNGDLMNKVYGLTNENAYKNDLTFVCIPNYYDPMVKLATGARWFDDIVDNNARRQREINER